MLSSLSASYISESSVTLLLSFRSASLFSSTFICAGLGIEYTVLSTSDILFASFSGSAILLPQTNSVVVSITGFTPLTFYSIYCYGANDIGSAYNLTTIVQSRLNIETSCCKVVTFVNAPESVFADLENYIGQSSESYLFSFTLSSAPFKNVTIIPVIINQDSTDNTLQLSPPSFQFTSSSNNLLGSFIIQGQVLISKSIVITLLLKGSSSKEYYNPIEITSVILPNDQPVAPPTLHSSALSDLGDSLYITFSGATNMANITINLWPCSDVFVFPGSDISDCSWLNSTVVIGYLQISKLQQSYISIGNTVTVIGGLIQAFCSNENKVCLDYPYLASMNVTVQKPANPVAPVVVLTIPSQASFCSALPIDATLSYGDGSRLWTNAIWSVNSNGGSDATLPLQNYLSSFGVRNISNLISVPADLLHNFNYTVSLTLYNVFGLLGVRTSAFTVSLDKNIPNVRIAGASSVNTYPGASLSMYSVVSKSSCATANTFKYSWTVYYNGLSLGIKSSNRDPTVLLLSPYTLSANRVYTVLLIVTATSGNSSSSSGFASATINVLSAPVTASVADGYNRQLYISSSSNVTLDASISNDGNFPLQSQQSASSLNYSWSCSISSISNYGSDCGGSFYQPISKGKITLLGSKVESQAQYSVRVYVYTADGRSDSKIVTIQFTDIYVPELKLSSNSSKFNPGKQLTVSSSIKYSAAVQAIWTASVSGQNVPFAALTSNSISLSASQVSTFFQLPIVFAGGNFIPGSLVTFRLSAYASGGAYSYGEISLQANFLPRGGLVQVNPDSGYGLSTLFSFLSSGWIVDSANLPLSYSFFYASSSNSPLLIVSKKSTSNNVAVQLPAGLSSLNFQLLTSVFVYDYFENSASANSTVTVTTNTSVKTSSFFAQQLNAFEASNDIGAFVGSINSVSSVLNILNCSMANASFCAMLHRDVCQSVPNTCSSCLSGFKG